MEKGNETIIAVADKELLGKTLIEGDLEFKVNDKFYGNEEIGEEVIEKLLKATSVNLIGERIVSLAVKRGLIDERCVIKIQKIPHALLFTI